jgi:hypothetical protein
MGHQEIAPPEDLYAHAIPKRLGYFAAEGIDVALQLGTTAVQLVAACQADIGQAGTSDVLVGAARGAPIPAFYNCTPRFGPGLAVLRDSPIRSPADLRGKRLGLLAARSQRWRSAPAMPPGLCLWGRTLSTATAEIVMPTIDADFGSPAFDQNTLGTGAKTSSAGASGAG